MCGNTKEDRETKMVSQVNKTMSTRKPNMMRRYRQMMKITKRYMMGKKYYVETIHYKHNFYVECLHKLIGAEITCDFQHWNICL